MEDNAKCFIKIRKGYYEKITYKELKERRENDNTYINKKFIPIQKTLIEVSLEEYKDFYKEIERNKYIKKKNKKIKFISIDEISEDMEIREKNILKDKDIDIDFEVERKIEKIIKILKFFLTTPLFFPFKKWGAILYRDSLHYKRRLKLWFIKYQ